MSEKNKTSLKNSSTLRNWLLRVIQGAIIGIGAILPGISGGVLCVIFGIYQPMMALLAHPVRTFKVYANLLLPVLIGWVLGFIGLAKGVEWLFKTYSSFAVWLFIGLITGTIPSLFKEAGKKGRGVSSWIAFATSLIVLFILLFIIQSGYKIQITPNIGWYFVCGLLWGIGLVVPGMSPSSILIFLGLYEPLTAGIGNLDLLVLLPLLTGVILIIVLSARSINYLFKKHYAVAYHTILGIVIASTLIIVPLQFINITETIISMACLAVGFLSALFMDKLGQKIKPKEED